MLEVMCKIEGTYKLSRSLLQSGCCQTMKVVKGAPPLSYVRLGYISEESYISKR